MAESLNAIFEELIERENKFKEQKNYLNNLRTEIDTNKRQLPQRLDQLNDLEQQIECKSNQMPNIVSELCFSETENQTLEQQIQTFEPKYEDFQQKLAEIKANRKQKIDEFIEQSFKFSNEFGLNGCVRNEAKNGQKRVEDLTKIRDDLRIKVENLEPNYKNFDSVVNERNELNDEISGLKERKNKLQNENFELKCVEKRLENEMKELKEKSQFGHEFIELRKELQNIEIKEKSFENSTQMNDNSNAWSDGNEVTPSPQLVVPKVEITLDIKKENSLERIENNWSESNAKEKQSFCEKQVNPQRVWDLKRRRLQHLSTHNIKE